MRTGISSERLANVITQWWPFVLLCAVCSARLIFAETIPSVMPTTGSLGTAAAAACVVSLVFSVVRRETMPPNPKIGRSLLLGALLFCGPDIALLLRPNDVAGRDMLLAASLVPVVVGVTLAALSESGLSNTLLLAGLAAAASLLLLFPEPRIHTLTGACVLILLPVMTGAGAAWLSAEARMAPAWSSAAACGGAALTFTVFYFLREHRVFPFSRLAFALDVLTLLCTPLALRRFGAARYAALFTVVPLIVLLYGFAVLRPGVSLRNVAGLLLLTGSSVALLRYRGEARADSALRLLP